jgi:hypothetical protein
MNRKSEDKKFIYAIAAADFVEFNYFIYMGKFEINY